jgi:peptidoglycan/xylan/chitin deacetylase (PgdA/CDA1 family)
MSPTPLRPARRPFYLAKGAATRTRSAAWLARGRPSAAGGGLRILFYHRISDEQDQLAVRPRRFREQMAFLAAQGFTVVDVPRAAELLAAGELPPRTIGLSFDDGYLDNAERALPVLAEHGFAATVFLASAITDGRVRAGWYERQPPFLSWDDVVALDGGSLGFEAHTVTHPSLVALDDEQARAEIEGSKRELADRLGREVTAFSYPAGLYGARERRLVAEAGFRAAVTTEPGPNRPGDDLLLLRRVQVEARDSLLDFRARVAGAHDRPLPFRAAYRRVRYGVEPASSRS